MGLAYGEIRTIDGVEVLPVAFVAYGFGGGQGPEAVGRGGGGGGVSIPLGVYSGASGEARFRPNVAVLLALAVPAISAVSWAIAAVVRARR